jgi:hypothetical protein
MRGESHSEQRNGTCRGLEVKTTRGWLGSIHLDSIKHRCLMESQISRWESVYVKNTHLGVCGGWEDAGSDLTHVQCETIQNLHNESLLHNIYPNKNRKKI